MAKVESADGSSFFELSPVHVTRARGTTGDADGLVCTIRFESYGEPVEGEANLTRGGLTRMIDKLLGFTQKRAGMMQLRSDTNEVEISLAAKRSKWTQKINVTGLAGVPAPDQPEPEASEELRVSFGATYRQSNAAAGAVEHRCGMVCTFDALAEFARALKTEFEAAPTRRGTGRVNPPGA
ncbi:MAG: hypothetical protein K8I27_00550 [Planctomycetes bacterium]|nr:hypothetical protein [Planctomycetota bacterium]